VAVLKVDATRLSSLTLGDSSNLKVGDVVFAIGDPFGVGETATMGIVSATGRGTRILGTATSRIGSLPFEFVTSGQSMGRT
jgi:S1-C subfamily serine protease